MPLRHGSLTVELLCWRGGKVGSWRPYTESKGPGVNLATLSLKWATVLKRNISIVALKVALNWKESNDLNNYEATLIFKPWENWQIAVEVETSLQLKATSKEFLTRTCCAFIKQIQLVGEINTLNAICGSKEIQCGRATPLTWPQSFAYSFTFSPFSVLLSALCQAVNNSSKECAD